jgi:hypothetical protein
MTKLRWSLIGSSALILLIEGAALKLEFISIEAGNDIFIKACYLSFGFFFAFCMTFLRD